MTDLLSLWVRMPELILLLQTVGLALALGTTPPAQSPVSLRSLQTSAVGAALIAIVHFALLPARMAGEWAGLGDPQLWAVALRSNAGPAIALRLLGLGVILWGTRARGQQIQPRARALVRLGALMAGASLLLVGHTAASPWRALLVPLLALHVAIAAWWFGSLWILSAAVRHSAQGGAPLVAGFSARAQYCVPLLLPVGVAMAALLMPGLSALGSPWGGLLLGKAALFAVLLGLAAANRWRIGPRLAQDERVGRQFLRIVRTEWLLIALVLALTAVMTERYAVEP